MELLTISQIANGFNVSTRTLRYYEKIGLLRSVKRDGNTYRLYDADTVTRLQQIIVLRRLRMPLKQIAAVLQSRNAMEIIEVFQQNLREVDDEITALSTIREILNEAVTRLGACIQQEVKLDVPDELALSAIEEVLTLTKTRIGDEKMTGDLNKASIKLSRLTDRDVRIIHLPPMTAAAYQCLSDGAMDGAEVPAIQAIAELVQSHMLLQSKPDTRRFGAYAHKTDENGDYRFELWVTVPEHMAVPEPFVKRQFHGGLYAAHTIPMGAYDEWTLLKEWAAGSDFYTIDWECRVTPELTAQDWVLEESLNYRGESPDDYLAPLQVDLLLPIKEK
jgi:DNA-binding transcriptional MerR regulator